MGKRKTAQDYINLADERGVTWVDHWPPKTILHKTTWECENGHIFKTTFSRMSIAKFSGCVYCGIDRRRLQPSDYSALAEKMGLVWNGPIVENVASKTNWSGKCGHMWAATYANIRRGSGCPECSHNRKKTKKDYLTVGAEKGIRWMGGELPQSVHDHTEWECLTCENIWSTSYNSLYRRGCPACVNMVNGVQASKAQIKLCRTLIGSKLNYPFEDKRIDIAYPGERIAIEYDCWYWHKDKLDEDRERANWLIENGWKVLSIKTDSIEPDIEDVRLAIWTLKNTADVSYIEIITDDWGER